MNNLKEMLNSLDSATQQEWNMEIKGTKKKNKS